MTLTVFVYALVVGAALLGLWAFVRLPVRCRSSLRVAFAHMLLAFAGLEGSVFALGRLLGDTHSAREAVPPLLLLFLPALIYVFFAAVYLLDRIQQLLFARY